MIWQNVTASVRKKLIVMTVVTALIALLFAAAAMILYDLKSFRESWVNNLTTQAEILARVSSPAIEFNDPKAAQENLSMLKVQPNILAGAIYTPDGRRFASYASIDSADADADFPATPGPAGHAIAGTRVVIVHPIVNGRDIIGTVYLRARFELLQRLANYAGIVAAMILGSLALAVVVASRLQKTITGPILAVADASRKVIEDRDFTRRVPKTTADEIGVLVDAFNGMLAEVGGRTEALEASNKALQSEMGIRKEAEDALLAADKRKDEFLATLAHELRNPLAPISNGLQILRMKGSDPGVSGQTLDVMERQLRQMVRLIDDLLDVSRITTGKLTIRKERLELQAVVGSALETVRPLMESRGHALSIALPAAPVFLFGDATRLSQVLSNLLNNAAKYTDRGGLISLKAELENHQATICVKDNGIGISPELLPRVFDMFTQADNSLERMNSGLGVGLSLARRLIELHGGSIEARSGGPGAGSEFIVRLPVAEGAEIAAPCASPAGQTAGSHRILLADDNIDFVNSMAGILSSLGHTIHVAYDGAEALAASKHFSPSFAFLDIGLPKMNGYELAKSLRLSPAGSSCILIAVTGWGQAKDKQRAFEAGFDHHLVKPVSLEQIQEILRSE
jgi:two-component system, sensor histidine kinase